MLLESLKLTVELNIKILNKKEFFINEGIDHNFSFGLSYIECFSYLARIFDQVFVLYVGGFVFARYLQRDGDAIQLGAFCAR